MASTSHLLLQECLMRLVRLALILPMLCVGSGAQQDTPRAFYTIRSGDSYRQAVLGVYQDYESRLSTHCSKIDINMNTSEAKVYGAIQTDADGNIVNAQWKERTD